MTIRRVLVGVLAACLLACLWRGLLGHRRLNEAPPSVLIEYIPRKDKMSTPRSLTNNNCSVQEPSAYLQLERADIAYYKRRNGDVVRAFEERKSHYPSGRAGTEQQAQQTPPHIPTRAHDVVDDFDDALLQAIIEDIGHDAQTVHDTVVQKTVQRAYGNVSTTKTNQNKDTLHKDILDWATAHGTDTQKKVVSRLQNVLVAIANRNAKIHNLHGDTEHQVVAAVWNGGNENVKRQVVNELLDCQRANGEVYCPTGVVTRVVNATLIETPDDMPRTRATLRTELLELAAQTRRELEETDSVYNKASDDEQLKRFKDVLEHRAYEAYKNVLPKKDITAELSEWISDV